MKKKDVKLGLALTIIGVVLMAAGAVAGESYTIMQKAVTICLECIGIG